MTQSLITPVLPIASQRFEQFKDICPVQLNLSSFGNPKSSLLKQLRLP